MAGSGGTGGYGVAGFGSGLAEGIASAFGRKRQTDLEDERHTADRRASVMSSLLPHLIENATDYNEIQPFIDQFILGNKPGAKAKKLKPGEIDPHAVLEQAFAPVFSDRGAAATPAAAGGEPPVADAAFSPAGATADQVASTGAPALPSAATPAAGAPERPSIGGVHLRTPDEQTQLEIHKQDALSEADMTRKAKAVRDFYTSFKALDPSMELRDALEAVFPGYTSPSRGGSASLSSLGSLGSQVARWTAEHGHAPSTEEFNTIRADYFAANRSMGVNRESLSRRLYNKPPSLLSPEELTHVDQEVLKYVGQEAFSRGQGTGQAQLNTDMGRMLTPQESTELQSVYGITRGQAAALSRVPLTPPQVQAATESYLLDKDTQTAAQLFEKVWPREPQPEMRRLALAELQRSQNPDFIQLMSLLKRMPLRLAVMTQGSRPSDTDKQVFDAAFPNTAADNWSVIQVPTDYTAGKQLLDAATAMAKTSRESIGVIPLAERGAPLPPKKGARTTQPGAAPYTLTYTAKDGTQKTATFESQAKLDQAKRALGIK